jgi:hypothetical protein
LTAKSGSFGPDVAAIDLRWQQTGAIAPDGTDWADGLA